MPYYKLFYHIVWGTKNREQIILPDFEAELYRVMAAKVIEIGGIVHAIGGVTDHIHLAVTIPPKHALAKVIGEIKGNSSHAVNHVIKPGHNFYWQEEYGVLSFGEKTLPAIVRYIQNQRQHHADNTLQTNLESW
jgi:putative transposase